MTKWLLSTILFALAAACPLSGGEQKPYMVCLDLESAFDKGKLGGKVGEMFRAKADRKKLYQTDAEYEWPDRAKIMALPKDDAKPSEISAEATEKLQCDVLIWGRIIKPESEESTTREHQTGSGALSHTTTVRNATALILHVKAIDIKGNPDAFAVDEIYECENNYYVSMKVEEVLKILTGTPTNADIQAADISNRLVPIGENLITAGSLDRIFSENPGVEFIPEMKKSGWGFPMTKGISFIADRTVQAAPDSPEKFLEGHIHYDISEQVAATTGLFCYTPYVKIEPETYYQAAFGVRTTGSKVIMFVKGYRDMTLPEVNDAGKPILHRQEVFKHQIRFYGDPNKWGVLATKPFLPRSVKPEHMPEYLRIQLYAYWPKGQVDFDNVSLRKCALPDAESKPGSELKKAEKLEAGADSGVE